VCHLHIAMGFESGGVDPNNSARLGKEMFETDRWALAHMGNHPIFDHLQTRDGVADAERSSRLIFVSQLVEKCWVHVAAHGLKD